MKKLVLLIVFSTYIFANIDIKGIDIFTNRTFVNQYINLDNTKVDLVGEPRLEDLRFNLIDGCKVLDSSIIKKDFKSDNLTINIEKLKDKISNKNNSVKALKSNISYLERTSISTISNSKSLENTSKFLKKEILDNHNEIYLISKKLKKDNEELKNLIKKRSNNKFSQLEYKITCKTNKSIEITYPIYNISRNGFYEIDYDSLDKKISIKNSSFITQSTGSDFKNIDINLYTYNYINQLKPNIFRPKYLDVFKAPLISYMQADEMVMSKAVSSRAVLRKSKAPSFSYVEDTTRSFFKASNINLISGKKTQVVFAKDKYEAKNSLEVDGYSLSQTFYKVDFKSKRLYGVLHSKLYLDGTYIGRGAINALKKDKKSSIYFGTNRFIDVKKELIKDMKEKPFFSMNKLKTQKIWKYTITNNHKKAQKITLLERLPISKHEDIVVKLIGKTKESKVDTNGKVYFDFELKANEIKVIEFGYEVQKPNKK